MSIKHQRESEGARRMSTEGVYFFSWDGHALGQVALSERW